VYKRQNPHILSVNDFGTDANGTVFIIFEDAVGETVKEKIKNDGAFSVERAVKIARQIASALSAAHTKGVIHKHLTGEKILLAETANGAETVKVLDFGAVKPEDDGMFAEEFSRSDLEYNAPEQISQTFEPDERSDIYSLGVIFYEMLTGEVPFTAETSEELLKKQAENPPPPFSAFRDDLPEGLELVVLRALANNPDMRYQNANAFVEDLNLIVKDSDNSQLTAQAKAGAATANNNLWKTAFVVLAGISLLAVGMIYATYTKQTDPITQMQTDAEGIPVQPLNPATGINEQNMLYTSDGTMPEIIGNPNMMMTDPVPGGDGFDPWARGGAPPPGAPNYPTGQVITIPGDGSGSQFMPDSSGGIILIPVPVNANTSVKPSPTPKDDKTPLPANTQTPTDPKETPSDTKPEAKPSPTAKPEVKPSPAAKPEPTTKPPATSDKGTQSGKMQDTDEQ
jgi:serine/threonine protein kinase